MAPSVWAQPLVVVRDVERSSAVYQQLLGADSGHGGDEYEQLTVDGELVLQLHRFDVEDHHGALANGDVPLGNGVVLWFEVDDFEGAIERVLASGLAVERGPEVNPNAQQSEIWVRDLDGYLVVLAGPSPYRPR